MDYFEELIGIIRNRTEKENKMSKENDNKLCKLRWLHWQKMEDKVYFSYQLYNLNNNFL